MPPIERIGADVECKVLFGTGHNPLSARNMGELLPGCRYHRTPPVFFDTSCVDGARRAAIYARFAELEAPPLPVSLIEIDEALVFGQGSVILPDGRLLHESAREFINAGQVPDGAVATGQGAVLPQRPIRRLPGRTLLVKRPWYRNYGHWLVDLMPIMPLIARHGITPDAIIIGDMPAGTLGTLMATTATRFLPGSQLVAMRDDEQLRCETLLYVTPTHIPPIFKHPLAMQLVADAAWAMGDDVEAPARKLYVSRQRSPERRIANAEAVEEVLGVAGFETVFPEEMSFSEQVAMFSGASAVVGVKGAGLTNVVFCRPGTELLVLSPYDFPDAFFWDLVTPRGVNYAEIFSQQLSAPDAGPSRSDFGVDVPCLQRYLAGERDPVAKVNAGGRRFRFFRR